MKHFLPLGDLQVGKLRHAIVDERADEPLTFRTANHALPPWSMWPQVREIVFQLMAATEATKLGLVETWWVKRGQGIKFGEIKAYAVVIQADVAWLKAGDEEVSLTAGKVVRINGDASCRSEGDDDCILLMVQLETE